MRLATRTSATVVSALAFCAPSFAAPPTMNDYAHGVVIEGYASTPMMELALPDAVYQAITRVDLRDVRVFNAEDAPVPHAFCAAPDSVEPVVTEESLPVFELKDAPRVSPGARIEVQTAGGTQLDVQEPAANAGLTLESRLHIMDVRGLEAPLRALQFDWASPDGASQASVRIEASEDLDQWESVVAATTLLRAGEGAQALRRERIQLPLRTYQYLRVQRVDDGPPLVLRGAVGERVGPAAAIEPQWFTPNALNGAKPNALLFDTTRAAPVSFARVRLARENSATPVTLQSRPDEKSPWRQQWTGEAYLVATKTERRESPPARFASVTDRYWRVLLPDESEAAPRPTIELGYRPMRLRFLTQGPGPYTLAYGSRRADPATPNACNGLLADVSPQERRAMIAEAYPGEFKMLGGEKALQPPPRRTPTRMIVLWGVLIVGVGLLVAMALSLLKRVRPDGG